jgi:hypothetical protein
MRLMIKSAHFNDASRVVDLWRACDLVASYIDPGVDFRFAIAGACSDVLAGEAEDGRIYERDGRPRRASGWLYYLAADPGTRGVGNG